MENSKMAKVLGSMFVPAGIHKVAMERILDSIADCPDDGSFSFQVILPANTHEIWVSSMGMNEFLVMIRKNGEKCLFENNRFNRSDYVDKETQISKLDSFVKRNIC